MGYTSFSSANGLGRQTGFSLLELIVTMAVAAILIGIAIPSYRSVVERNSVTARVNDLVGDLHYARSEAATRGQDVYICASSDGTRCTQSGDWTQGWIVYTPNDPTQSNVTPNSGQRLRTQQLDTEGFTLTSLSRIGESIVFDANGFAHNSARTFCARPDSTNGQIKITIAVTGRVKTARENDCDAT